MIVDVVLPAVLGLVLVRKTSVVASWDRSGYAHTIRHGRWGAWVRTGNELEGLGDVSSKLLGIGHFDLTHDGVID